MHLSVVLGTRPEVIKLAPVVLAARARGHRVTVVFTGQHQHIALPLMRFFGIEPDLSLDVATPNQTLSSLSSRVLARLDENADRVKADFVLVQGDTTSAFCAAYWAFCHKVPVAHVEAGLRTYDLTAPFPEEANRQLIGRVSAVHFPPTSGSEAVLRKEKVSGTIVRVGNTGIDALRYAVGQVGSASVPAEERLDPSVAAFIADEPFVLVTAHRRESFGAGFDEICKGIRAVADAKGGAKVVYPVHPNPNVRAPVEKLLGGHPRILLCNPQPYFAFVTLMGQARVLLTDSGGVQEEGPSLKKPIIVMRSSTERPEGVKAGFAKLVGTNARRIERETLLALKRGCRGRGGNPYGDGKSAERIIRALEKAKKS